MSHPTKDERTDERRARDEAIASEPPLPPPELPADARPAPVETFLHRPSRHPKAILGVVENGLVRPLDPDARLTENSRVIIVASDDSPP